MDRSGLIAKQPRSTRDEQTEILGPFEPGRSGQPVIGSPTRAPTRLGFTTASASLRRLFNYSLRPSDLPTYENLSDLLLLRYRLLS